MGRFDFFPYPKCMDWEEYIFPNTIEEALELLQRYEGEAQIVAGGTDVIPLSRSGMLKAKIMVDISRVAELNFIKLDNGHISIGSLVTHAQLAKSPIIREKATALAESAERLGSPQIRNMGTLGGNIVNAQPAADCVIPLVALDAHVFVRNRGGEKKYSVQELFKDVGQSLIDPTQDILTHVVFPALGTLEGSASLRLSKRKALTLPMLNVAVVVKVSPDRKIFEDVRIAIGPVAPIPKRLLGAESVLRGSPINDESIKKASETAAKESQPRDSILRGSAEYRKNMVQVMVRRAIILALERIGGANA